MENKENPFEKTNELIEKFMAENELDLMHLEMFIDQKFGKICTNNDYYETLAETEETGKLIP